MSSKPETEINGTAMLCDRGYRVTDRHRELHTEQL